MKTVLFVDDDVKIRKAVSLYFKNKFQVLLAETGNHAIEQIQNNEVDLIVSDYGMMDGDGVKLKETLNNSDYRDIPFIVVSGQIDKVASIKFANLKVDYILEKPLDFKELDSKINELLVAYDKKVEEKKLLFLGKNTGQIIHDINNSLGIILMSSDIGLTSSEKNEKLEKLFNRSKTACCNIVEIVTKYKKLANEDKIDFKEMSLESLYSSLEKEATAFAEANNVKIHLNKKDLNNRIISLDPLLFKQVVLNLWSNAKDSVKSGTFRQGEIQMGFIREGDKLFITVKDNGGGIRPDIQEKLFQEKNSSKGSEGTGMGLSYCKFITELHFGKISLSKTDSQGTEFMIQLPLVKEA